ncbi:HIT family protein [Candidatus Uhrbacteria bacterium CG_4_10_14_0_2_um_filter_41_7]|uniref:HIT family protein n=1 Tax=Candidatus Uhrbacteria bacterium CG_4_9_14_3_um_filter_41_35 TaxID=1975034 RepID=A0A2M7XD03_9BACT|nr:MAG: HIT family protein [Candidatus Uhrbacteria bacterium CG_4_10_14_0_2_um_filter_41_7]PJA45743.1 MAG: HIT family protein [Candidatus Uhrbacteria bacterium CG_4_9_14_3_um_filter_41_35]
MDNCLFCKIISGEIPAHKIYEDDETLAFLDIGPVSEGHTLIIPKEHATDLTAGSEESALAIMQTIKEIAPKITEALGATGYNLGMNNGRDAGQDVFHTHMHLMPRYENDERKFVKSFPDNQFLAQIKSKIAQKLTN